MGSAPTKVLSGPEQRAADARRGENSNDALAALEALGATSAANRKRAATEANRRTMANKTKLAPQQKPFTKAIRVRVVAGPHAAPADQAPLVFEMGEHTAPLVVGSNAGCSVALRSDAKVCPEHGRISMNLGLFWYADQFTEEGSAIAHPAKEFHNVDANQGAVQILHGDKLHVGDSEIVFEISTAKKIESDDTKNSSPQVETPAPSSSGDPAEVMAQELRRVRKEFGAESKEYQAQIAKMQRAQQKKMFEELDKDGDGGLNRTEIRAALETLNSGIAMSDEEFEDMYLKMDLNGDGRISMDEYVKAIFYKQLVFQFVDADVSGTLNKEEARQAFDQLLGFQMSNKEFSKAYGAMDKDHNGEVSFKEFKRMFKTKRYKAKT